LYTAPAYVRKDRVILQIDCVPKNLEEMHSEAENVLEDSSKKEFLQKLWRRMHAMSKCQSKSGAHWEGEYD